MQRENITTAKARRSNGIAKECTYAGKFSHPLMPVPPSPELQMQIRKDLERLRSEARGPLAQHLTARAPSPPGKDDGLIYPGDFYPLGTSAAPVRRAATERAPISGTIRAIVVLAEFTDKAFEQPAQHYKDLFFSKSVLPHGSLQEYYAEVSNGQVDMTGEVLGPYTLPKTLAEYADGDYGCPDPDNPRVPNAQTMARDVAVAASADVDFAPYDNDGDGFVDAFMIVHAGRGAEETGNKGDIWSHKWVLEGGAYTVGSVKIYGYDTVPEDAKLGVCCQELGHLLFGWPDLYDTDYSSEGIGNWCLMAAGSWNGGGEIPAHPSAWCKAQQGWVTVACPTASGTQSIQAVETGHAVLRLWKDCAAGQEYFLVENRQKIGSDQGLPGDGLLVWHIDDAMESNDNESHPKVRLLQADGKKDLERGVNRGDAGDSYPGSSGNTSFTKTTNPNSLSYGRIDTRVAITNIGKSAPVMTANVMTSSIGPPKVGRKADISVLEARIAALEARLGLVESCTATTLGSDLS